MMAKHRYEDCRFVKVQTIRLRGYQGSVVQTITLRDVEREKCQSTA